MLVGFVLLVIGGNWLLKSAVGFSLRLNIPKIIIGMTIVSFATSAPELIVSLNAALNDSPAIAINNQGNQLIIWRTTTAGGSIRRILLDTNGNVILAASDVVTGNVTTDGLACYWKDDQAYIVFNDSVSGITVIKSDDYSTTFS